MHVADSARTGWRRAAIALLACTGFVAVYWLVYAYAPQVHQRFLRGEDKLVEWVTFAGFAGASGAVFAALRFRRAMPRGIPWFLAGLGLFFFLCAAEEISWGQRVIGFETPDSIRSQNEQDEFNLHNLDLEHFHPVAVVEMLLLLFGIAAPLALAWAKKAWPRAMARSVAPLWVVPLFLWTELLKPVERLVRPAVRARFGDEVANVARLDTMELLEMSWAIAVVLAAWGIYTAWRRASLEAKHIGS